MEPHQPLPPPVTQHHEPYPTSPGTSLWIVFVVMIAVVAAIGATLLFTVPEERTWNAFDTTVPEPLANMCSEDVLYLCAFKIYLAENPNLDLPREAQQELREELAYYAGEDINCPATFEELSACVATILREEIEYELDYYREEYAEFEEYYEDDYEYDDSYGDYYYHEYEPRQYTLDDFVTIESTWRSRFITTDSEIPQNAYQAFYFDSTEPNITVYSETVPGITLMYDNWDEGDAFNIDPDSFGGYWIGDITVPESGLYELGMYDDRSEKRVLIDGHEFKESIEELYLEAGTYRIEFEFLNDSHYVTTYVTLQPSRTTMYEDELLEIFSELPVETEIWYVGMVETYAADRTGTVTLTESETPVVLLLSSDDQLTWNIENPHNTPIAGIVYSTYEAGTTVTGDITDVPIYKTEPDMFYTEYSLEADCYDGDLTHFYCESTDNIAHIDDWSIAITGRPITGFSGAYDFETITVPEQVITESLREDLLDSYQQIRAEWEARKEAQTLENIF